MDDAGQAVATPDVEPGELAGICDRGVSWGSCGELAGVSPVGGSGQAPRSWWPAEGEIGLLKRHDKVAVGGEHVSGSCDEES
jgi:hypothetical protein